MSILAFFWKIPFDGAKIDFPLPSSSYFCSTCFQQMNYYVQHGATVDYDIFICMNYWQEWKAISWI